MTNHPWITSVVVVGAMTLLGGYIYKRKISDAVEQRALQLSEEQVLKTSIKNISEVRAELLRLIQKLDQPI